MTLADELVNLHAVQRIDTQIYRREQALKALDSGEALKQAAIELLKRHDAAKDALLKATTAQRDRELELKSLEAKRKSVHDRLYGGKITNPKELGDLQKDEEMIDVQIGRLEETVLEAMERTEGAKTVEATLAGELAAAKRRWQQTVAHTKAETERLQGELAALRPEREALARKVNPALLRRYDDIRRHREGLGLVVTDTDTCPGCHVKLSSRIQALLREEGEELTLCENCGRILMRSAHLSAE